MENLIKEYQKISNKRKEIEDSIIELEKEKTELYKQFKKYIELKEKECEKCNHIWIKTNIDFKDKSYATNGCIKCGLTNSIKYIFDKIFEESFSDFDKEEIDIYINQIEKSCNKGTKTNIVCDFNLAKEIYNKIKNENQNIDDKTIMEYLEKEIEEYYINKYIEKYKKR